MSLMSPMKYCPNELISRGETAKLVLLAKEGSSYTPSPATFFIVDVPIDSPYSAWIEDLRNRINASSNNLISNRPFRPNENITEVELLIWLIRIFNNP